MASRTDGVSTRRGRAARGPMAAILSSRLEKSGRDRGRGRPGAGRGRLRSGCGLRLAEAKLRIPRERSTVRGGAAMLSRSSTTALFWLGAGDCGGRRLGTEDVPLGGFLVGARVAVSFLEDACVVGLVVDRAVAVFRLVVNDCGASRALGVGFDPLADGRCFFWLGRVVAGGSRLLVGPVRLVVVTMGRLVVMMGRLVVGSCFTRVVGLFVVATG